MTTLLFAEISPIWQYFFGISMFLVALFLIMLVLVQRGKGGGLAGAFGGVGGQSAFGTKAGDTFTRITIYMATFWIILCVVAVKVLSPPPISEEGTSTIGSPIFPGQNPISQNEESAQETFNTSPQGKSEAPQSDE